MRKKQVRACFGRAADVLHFLHFLLLRDWSGCTSAFSCRTPSFHQPFNPIPERGGDRQGVLAVDVFLRLAQPVVDHRPATLRNLRKSCLPAVFRAIHFFKDDADSVCECHMLAFIY